jgi:hypothetical protein
MITETLWWLFTSLIGWLTIGSFCAIALLIFNKSDAAEAMRFFWCAMTHQRWHVVQHERPTLTRLYCTRCGHVHLKYKRMSDWDQPTTLPEEDETPTRKE